MTHVYHISIRVTYVYRFADASNDIRVSPTEALGGDLLKDETPRFNPPGINSPV